MIIYREGEMIKIRLNGTKEEIKKAAEVLKNNLNVLSTSDLYKDRGENLYYRVYIDCEIKKEE